MGVVRDALTAVARRKTEVYPGAARWLPLLLRLAPGCEQAPNFDQQPAPKADQAFGVYLPDSYGQPPAHVYKEAAELTQNWSANEERTVRIY